MSLAREEEAELLNQENNSETIKENAIQHQNQTNSQKANRSINNNINHLAKNITSESDKIKHNKQISNKSQMHINKNSNRDCNKSVLKSEEETNDYFGHNSKEFNAEIKAEKLFFENKFNCKVNKSGFYLRMFVCLIGLFFIALNSYTNCLVTEEESEGMKDKIIETLLAYTQFLQNDSNIHAKAITILFAVLYDGWILFGIFLWVSLGKSNRFAYSSCLYFSLMLLLQHLFLIEMPLVKGHFILLSVRPVNSFFLNFPINKNAFYNGQVGFLLIVLFEVYQDEFYVLFYCGLFYLVNLIAYLMALQSTNSLCVISAILAALYFDKISEVYICKYCDVIEIIKKAINDRHNGGNNNLKKHLNEPFDSKSKETSNRNKVYMAAYDEITEECETLKKECNEEYEKFTLSDKKDIKVVNNKNRVNKVFEDRLNEKIKMNDFSLINKEQKQVLNEKNRKTSKKRTFDNNNYILDKSSSQEVSYKFIIEEDKDNDHGYNCKEYTNKVCFGLLNEVDHHSANENNYQDENAQIREKKNNEDSCFIEKSNREATTKTI